jgi:two-component system, OmpR family, sensor histidine kinase KdpD
MNDVTQTPSARGSLRVYLGAAPGVGKTYAMLNEGVRRAHRGADVVVGLVETHDRPLTAQAIGDLEALPRQTLVHRGSSLTDMDVDAVLARRPQVALVDELAHTNVPGCRNEKRWQDVEELLEAGIDVITTVNIQHLESLNDVVYTITGIKQAETVPDEVVRRADQIELVDMSPQALRRRMAHGNVYRPEKVDAALTNYFRVGNLTALRELALLWTADRVDQALELYREENDIEQPWPTRERVVVALTGGPEGETLLRRGARISQRAVGGELLALHVTTTDGLSTGSPEALVRQRRLVEELAGSFHIVTGGDVADAILDFSRGVNATQIVLGAPRRSRLVSALSQGVGAKVVRDSGDIDVHIVTHERSSSHLLPTFGASPLSRDRQVLGWVGAVVGIPLLAALLLRIGSEDLLPVTLMLFLAAVLAVSLLGGIWPALAAATVAALIVDYFYFPPYNTLRITSTANLVAVILLVLVAVLAARVVDVSARRLREAAVAKAEADTLAALTGTILRGEHAIPALLEQLRVTFGLDYVALRERLDRSHRWRVRESTGQAPADVSAVRRIPISDDLEMLVAGGSSDAQNMRVLTAVAAQAQALVEREQLRTEARLARQERERTRIRTALLAAVSHDLRTPLAGSKAAVTALRSHGLHLDEADREDLLATVEESTDRLQSLIDNLLDMSRLDAGAVAPVLGEVWVPDLIAGACKAVPPRALEVQIPLDLPPVLGDEGLLERAVANVVENAVRYSPDGRPVRIDGEQVGEVVVVRVIDSGPGVPAEADRLTMFEPFQRLGDVPGREGVGLGLAVARGFVEACSGKLEAEDTPGGGLTMIFWLKACEVFR